MAADYTAVCGHKGHGCDKQVWPEGAHHVVESAEARVGRLLALVDDEAEVRELAAVVRQQHVLWLEVPVDEAELVQEEQRAEHLRTAPPSVRLSCSTGSQVACLVIKFTGGKTDMSRRETRTLKTVSYNEGI